MKIVKVLQITFTHEDLHMYYDAHTSNLNEELGQVDPILFDKTGTLTCNSVEFVIDSTLILTQP